MKLRHKQTGEEFEYDGPICGISQRAILLRRKSGLKEYKFVVPSDSIRIDFEQLPEAGDSNFIGPVRYAGPIKPKRKYRKRKRNEEEGVSS